MFNKKAWSMEYRNKNKNKIKIYNKEYRKTWYQNNKEYYNRPEVKEKRKTYLEVYYQNNKDNLSQQNKERYQNNKDKINQRNKKYYQKNRNKIDQYKTGWRKQNPEKAKRISIKSGSKRRIILKGFLGNDGITKNTQTRVWNECEGVCVYCKRLTNQLKKINPIQSSYDHIHEVSHLNPSIHPFNPNGISNIVIACRSCNSKRHNKPILEWCKEIGFIPEIIQNKLIQQKEQMKLEG